MGEISWVGYPKLSLGIVRQVLGVQLLVWGMGPAVGERCLLEEWAFLLGEGVRVYFWFDDRARVGPFFVLYPRVFRVVSNKESSINDDFV